MGEVYRARDARLQRDVAIKVLPASLVNDPDALARFEREARAVAALSHPNILAIFDFGKEGQVVYAAMELLEGETLRSRLDAGPLPLRKAIETGRDIARGLAAAHDQGIVHRDLKPENLFVTRDGRLKILDFGLARQVSPLPADGTKSPTVARDTTPGTILGTAGYMAPEQLKGMPADARSDIFAFGAVLYEMLSGQRAFRGGNAVETLHAILHDEPAGLGSPDRPVAPALDKLVRRCLEKNPDERYRSAHDLAFDLDLLSGLSVPTGAVTSPRVHPRAARASLAVVAALAIAAGGYWTGRRARAPLPRYEQITFRHGTIYSARFAPDGRSVLYSAAWDGNPLDVWVKTPESPDAVPRNLPGGNLLAVSRSGELAVALGGCREPRVQVDLCGGTLARLPLTGGAPREIVEKVVDADWGPGGTDLVITRPAGDAFRLEFPIGKVLYETSGYASNPRMSPKGDLIAFFDHPVRGDDRGSVAVVDLKGRTRTLSLGWESLHGLAWSPSADEIWFTGSKTGSARSLYSVSLSGRERLVAAVPGGITLRDVSPSGRLLLTHDVERLGIMALAPGESRERDLSWLEWSHGPVLSGDGKTVLFDEEGQAAGSNYTVCIRKTDGSPLILLGEGNARALSPDGRWVLAGLPQPDAPLLLLPTGAGERKTIQLPTGMAWEDGRFFPDGKRILLQARAGARGTRLWVLPLEGGPPRPLTPEGLIAGFALSPDGRRVAARIGTALLLFSEEGGDPRPVPGAAWDDTPIAFGKDGRSLFLLGTFEVPRRVWCLDIATGRRTLWKELMPPDPAGIRYLGGVSVTPDGRSYAYSYLRWLSDLFVADDLK
jgi:hypothetical protein